MPANVCIISISSHFGRIDALRWTPQMEEALRVIEKNKPYPTDEGFVFEVRLHLLMQRAAHIREQHDADRARTTAATAGPVPGFLYLKALRGQLQEYRDALSPELKQQGKKYSLIVILLVLTHTYRYPHCIHPIC
jgi:hypothetical protein